jgi:flagella synthesis protein FlgN
MSHAQVSDRDLARHLDEQIAAMQTVLSALQAEHQALKERDGDALLRVVDSKAASVSHADQLEKRRHAIMAQMGIGSRPVGGNRQFSRDAGVSQRWQQMLALTERCRAINEANGQLIRGQRRRVDAAMQILRGGAISSTEYGPAGAARSGAYTRSLGLY